MKSTKKAYLFAGLSVFFWSTVATSFKLALRGYDFIQLIFYISAVSVVLLFSYIVAQGKLKLIFKQSRKEWLVSMGMGPAPIFVLCQPVVAPITKRCRPQ